jgi:hypothetical protein
MFKKSLIIIQLQLLILVPTVLYGFDRTAALKHADRYANAPFNSNFTAWPSDCANFVSQCLLAGNIRFDKSSGYKPEGLLIRVAELTEELSSHHGSTWHDTRPASLRISDPLILRRDYVGFDPTDEHAMIITATTPDRYNAHTASRFHRLVSDIPLRDNTIVTETLRYFLLPDAPIIKYMKVTQDQGGEEKIIYEYKYDDDPDYIPFETNTATEYYKHTYNGLTPRAENPTPAISGVIKLKIIFDTVMKTSSIDVAFGKNSPYTMFSFIDEKFSKTLHNNDTWEGKYEIPEDYGDNYTGMNKISVNAEAIDGTQLDSDGKLCEYNPGKNTKHNFIIDPGLDLIFVIDTTGSMSDDISAVKASAISIVDTLDSLSKNYRIAVVSFEDFPVYPYGTSSCGDYMYHDIIDFSNDKDSIVSAIQSITLRCGGDWPESHYSALMHSFQKDALGGWRDGVVKTAIIMTDAPPHHPEPITGYTSDDVVNAAINLDPVNIYPIVIGGSSIANFYMQTLAEETGGKVFNAGYASQVVDAILSAIDASVHAPVAEAGGPYEGAVGIPVAIDATSSYDLNGEIIFYEWDWGNDGVYDETTTLSSATHIWHEEFNGMVRLRVTDNDGLTSIDTADIVIINNYPPVAICKDILVNADDNCQATAYIDAGSYDSDGDPVTVTYSSIGPYSKGEHIVTLTITDSLGASDSCTGVITVQDTTPPRIDSLIASPSTLWPANHKMMSVNLDVSVSDNCDVKPICSISSVETNESVNDTGDGTTSHDWEIVGSKSVNLRAERSGKETGRIYSVNFTCHDIADNSSSDAVDVIVPHDRGGRSK